jgi:hypothetical protein
MPNTIHLAGDFRLLASLKAADDDLLPGMLVALDADGEIDKQGTRGAACERMVVLENALLGGNTTTAYTEGEIISVAIEAPGSESLALLAAGADVDVGDLLTPKGNGLLEEVSSTYKPIAVALEACDISDSGDVDTLIKVRWL